MAERLTPATATCLVIAVATLVRLVFAAGMGLGIDESYMVASAHGFHLSYFDHPPISWWMELGVQRLTGLHTPLVVRLPFILLFAASGGLMFGLTDRLFGKRAGFWAVVGLNVSPVFSVAFGTWVLPDGPLDFFLLAAAWALAGAIGVARPDLEAAPRPGLWPLAGLCAGLAMASKYNAALTLLGALLFLLFDARGRRALASVGPWLACLIALLVFSPVLIWNGLHHWVSFGYQGGRATGFGVHPLRPFMVWAGEAVFVGPWLFVPMIVLMSGGLRAGADRRVRFLALLAIIPVILFSAIAFWSSRKILFHWAAPGYLMLFPVLGDWVTRLSGRLRRWAGAVAAGTGVVLSVAVAFIVMQLNFGIVPQLPGVRSADLQALDWSGFRTALARRGDLSRPKLAIAALRWFDAGKIAYAVGPGLPVTVFEGDPHEFGITTPPRSLIGDDILIAAMPGSEAAIMRRYAGRFRSIAVTRPIDITHHGHVLLRVPMLLGHDLRFWPGARR